MALSQGIKKLAFGLVASVLFSAQALASGGAPARGYTETDYPIVMIGGFLAFDEILEKHNLEKIKTIGDAYMCAGGLPKANVTNPVDAVRAALDIQAFMETFKRERVANNRPFFEARVGVHTGAVVAGVIGKKKFAYDIWGDAVNVASRMESSGEVGKVNISGTTYEIVREHFNTTYRGKIAAKNKGEVDMYFVDSISWEAMKKGLFTKDEE